MTHICVNRPQWVNVLLWGVQTSDAESVLMSRRHRVSKWYPTVMACYSCTSCIVTMLMIKYIKIIVIRIYVCLPMDICPYVTRHINPWAIVWQRAEHYVSPLCVLELHWYDTNYLQLSQSMVYPWSCITGNDTLHLSVKQMVAICVAICDFYPFSWTTAQFHFFPQWDFYPSESEIILKRLLWEGMCCRNQCQQS